MWWLGWIAASWAAAPATWVVRTDVQIAVDADGLPEDPALRERALALGVSRWSRVIRPSQTRADPQLFRSLGLDRAYRVTVSDPDPDAETTQLRLGTLPRVMQVERAHGGQGDYTPDDPFLDEQWAQHNLGTHSAAQRFVDTNALAAWDLSMGDPGIVIAMLDSGVSLVEPDLRLWQNLGEVPNNGLDDDGNGFVDDVVGWDFAYDDADPTDGHGHGSHTAGTAAALGDNGIGHVGMCPDCTVMALKNLDDFNLGDQTEWAESVVYAADHGAAVISMSEGGSSYNNVLHDAVRYATGLGVPVVTSAGNDDDALPHFPSSLPETISVGATTPADLRVTEAFTGWGSNYGPALDVVAPGLDVSSLSENPGEYDRIRGGTSMATPQVSGLVALMLHLDPTLTPDEVRAFLHLGAADPVGDADDTPGWDEFYGAGRIDARRTLELVIDHPAGPPAMKLSCAPSVERSPLQCAVDGAEPFATVTVAAGTSLGTGPCPGALPECLGVVGARIVGQTVADGDGVAQLSVSVPQQAAIGSTVALQAVTTAPTAALSLPWSGTLLGCGDGVITGDETCDDANSNATDGCDACVASWASDLDQVDPGGHHTCAVDLVGDLHCWGRDLDGQATPPPGTFTEATAGRYHSCALDTSTSQVECWGSDAFGQAASPPFVVADVVAGWYHTCALDGTGMPWCWGDDVNGAASPPSVAFDHLALGFDHGCGLRSVDQRVSCWGDGADGQTSPPADVMSAVDSGGYHSCAIVAATGALTCWGDNAYGQAATPPGSWLDVATGLIHTCAIDLGGQLSCWGAPRRGLLDAPAGTFTEVHAGRYHTCAREVAGHWRCWGGGGEGALNLSCGDDIVQVGEECDDGGRSDGDGCSADCLSE